MAAQGWCPSTFRVFDAPDGGLARIKVPGGILDLDQVQAVSRAADRFGNGTVEITSRANLQIRGVDPQRAAALRALLAPVGLSAPTAEIEDRRNVLASPTAGLALDELVDVRPIVSEVVESLDAMAPAGELPHKFGVLLDGGGTPTLRGREIDAAFGAVVVTDGGGYLAFELALGAPLPPATDDPVEPAQVVARGAVSDLVVTTARLCSGAHPGIAASRMSDIVESIGLPGAIEALYSLGAPPIRSVSADAVVRTVESAEAPLGNLVARTFGAAFVGVAPTVPLTPEMLDRLADAMRLRELDEVRLTPWRSIVVPVDGARADDLLASLTTAGWTVDAAAAADLVGAAE